MSANVHNQNWHWAKWKTSATTPKFMRARILRRAVIADVGARRAYNYDFRLRSNACRAKLLNNSGIQKTPYVIVSCARLIVYYTSLISRSSLINILHCNFNSALATASIKYLNPIQIFAKLTADLSVPQHRTHFMLFHSWKVKLLLLLADDF